VEEVALEFIDDSFGFAEPFFEVCDPTQQVLVTVA
jgi:hypothetical protein